MRIPGQLALLYAGVLTAGLADGLSRVALAKYLRDDLGASILAVSSLTTWYMAARAGASLASGVAAYSSRRAWLALVSLPLPLIGLAAWLSSATTSIPLIMVLNAAWGFLAGLVWPQAQAMASLASRGWSGASMSIYFTLGGLGIAAGQYLYGWIPGGNANALRASGAVYAASGVLLAMAALGFPYEAGVTQGSLGGLRGLRIDRLSAWVLLAAFSAGFGGGVLREFLYVYLGEAYGMTRGELGSFLAAAGILALVVSIAVGPAADRIGTGSVLAAVLVAGIVGYLMLSMETGVAAALVGLALAQTSVRSSMPLTRNAAAFRSDIAVALVGASNTLSSLGMMTGPMVGARLYESLQGRKLAGILPGEGSPFLASALMLMLTLALYALARKPKS